MSNTFFTDMMRMMRRDFLIFVDTEPYGIPQDESRSFKDVDNWPPIKQISWLVYSKEGKLLAKHNYVTSKTELQSPDSVVDYLQKEYLPIHEILPKFLQGLKISSAIIGHNISFDVNVILAELYRLGLDTKDLECKTQFCTMHSGVSFCDFETRMGNRYPKLQELYSKLFHKPFSSPHDAYCDITATAECFFKMVDSDLSVLEDYPNILTNDQRQSLAFNYSSKGRELLSSNKQSAEGLRLCEKAATLGDVDCQMIIASSCEKSDKDKAIKLYESAGRQGRIEACWQLAKLNPECSDYYYKKWAEYCDSHFDKLDYHTVCPYLNAIIYGNYGVKKDLKKAHELCEKAISNGYPVQNFYLAVLEKLGEKEDYFRYLREFVTEEIKKRSDSRSSAPGLMPSDIFLVELVNLIKCYFYGVGTDVDYYKAYDLIEVSQRILWANRDLGFILGQFYERGLAGVSNDYHKALYYYGLDSSNPKCALRLGVLYLRGWGCTRDKKKAKGYLLYAKEKGEDVGDYLKEANSWFF